MAASYPGAIKSFTAVVNGTTKLVAALFNVVYDEVTAIETKFGTADNNAASGMVQLDANSLIPVPQLGAYDGSTYPDIDTVYGPMPTDGIIMCSHEFSAAGGIQAIVGATDTPNLIVGKSSLGTNEAGTMTFPVKDGYYFKIYKSSGTVTITNYWIPLGS
jgi:hypothetical protein